MQELIYEIALQRQDELKRLATRRGQLAPRALEIVLVRPAASDDESVLRALAELDGTAFAPGSYLCAEADGRLTAALRLDDGTVIADPFAPTCELRKILELRARQLTGRRRRRRWLLA
jgi:hypothetical protein